MVLQVGEILGLFRVRGAAMYGGEAVSQLEHALQCAQLAEEAGAGPELVAACLLHDFGHLLAGSGDRTQARGLDDAHQHLALPFLREAFPESVLEPIRLHVDAKRYLCHVEPEYWDALSPVSKHSLVLQGGPYGERAAATFRARPHAAGAIQLRRWDDLAKSPRKPTPELEHYAGILRRCTLTAADQWT